jgi:hypothetical protein
MDRSLLEQVMLITTLLATALAALAQCWNAIETRRLVNISQFAVARALVLPPKVLADTWNHFSFSVEVQNVGGGTLAIEQVDLVWWRKLGEGRRRITLPDAYPVLIPSAHGHTFKHDGIDLLAEHASKLIPNLPPSRTIEGMLILTCVGLEPTEIHCHFA